MSANDKAAATYGPGRTTPPLEARIAAVLTSHLEHHGDEYDLRLSASIRKLGGEVAAMLAPVIRVRESAAWDEGADAEFSRSVLHRASTPNPYRSEL